MIMIKIWLDALTEEKNQLEIENLKFQTKLKSKLTPEDALNFLYSIDKTILAVLFKISISFFEFLETKFDL